MKLQQSNAKRARNDEEIIQAVIRFEPAVRLGCARSRKQVFT